jgi:hypothetical protein
MPVIFSTSSAHAFVAAHNKRIPQQQRAFIKKARGKEKEVWIMGAIKPEHHGQILADGVINFGL